MLRQDPFDTFLVGGDTAEVSGMKFSNDGKMMLLSTTSSHVYVLDAYTGKKVLFYYSYFAFVIGSNAPNFTFFCRCIFVSLHISNMCLLLA